jgi:hypothetical protein
VLIFQQVTGVLSDYQYLRHLRRPPRGLGHRHPLRGLRCPAPRGRRQRGPVSRHGGGCGGAPPSLGRLCGRRRSPRSTARRLGADGGRRTGRRTRGGTYPLQHLADHLGVASPGGHNPPGPSQWNTRRAPDVLGPPWARVRPAAGPRRDQREPQQRDADPSGTSGGSHPRSPPRPRGTRSKQACRRGAGGDSPRPSCALYPDRNDHHHPRSDPP